MAQAGEVPSTLQLLLLKCLQQFSGPLHPDLSCSEEGGLHNVHLPSVDDLLAVNPTWPPPHTISLTHYDLFEARLYIQFIEPSRSLLARVYLLCREVAFSAALQVTKVERS